MRAGGCALRKEDSLALGRAMEALIGVGVVGVVVRQAHHLHTSTRWEITCTWQPRVVFLAKDGLMARPIH